MIQVLSKEKNMQNAIYYNKICASDNIFYFKIMQHSYFHCINKQLRFINENRIWMELI